MDGDDITVENASRFQEFDEEPLIRILWLKLSPIK